MHVLAAPDKFRGTLDAAGVAASITRACDAARASCDEAPLADGGEGFLDALGGANRTTCVSGPTGDDVEAGWRLSRGTAVIEMARASGLSLVGGQAGNDPLAASTYGTGELIQAALDAGARRILVGVGGSATTDGGLGALRALHPPHRLRGVELVVACDVRTRFVEAATRFGPQKGASPAQVRLLQARLQRLADAYLEEYGVDVRDLEGSGAAGGLAGGLAAVGASLVGGFEVVAEEVDLEERMARADLVVTGEGFLDAESFEGKVVGEVIATATSLRVPVAVVVGEVLDEVLARPEVASCSVVSLVERFGEELARAKTAACIEAAVTELLATA